MKPNPNAELFYDRLNLLLDQRDNPAEDPELQQIISQDEECQALWDAHLSLFDGLQDVDIPNLSADFTSNVVQQAIQAQVSENQVQPSSLETDSSTRKRFGSYRVMIALAIAASVLAVISISLNSGSDPNNNPNNLTNNDFTPEDLVPPEIEMGIPTDTYVMKEGSVVQQPDQPAPQPILTQWLAEASGHTQGLAMETQASLSDLSALIPSQTRFVSDEPANPGESWINRVRDGLAPLNPQVDGAIEVIKENINTDIFEAT